MTKQQTIVKRVLVVGLGLIGASFAKALKNNGACEEVLGSTRSDETLKIALEKQVIDWGSNNLDEAVAKLESGDVILIATPTLTTPIVLSKLKNSLSRGIIVSDAASVKGDLANKAVEMFGEFPEHLVLAHPIAGSEKSGIDALNEALYQNHRVILTPAEETNADSLKKVEALWESVGAVVSTMGIKEHDHVLGLTSHLPHVLAYALVDALAKQTDHDDIFKYAAGGFRDFTRIAGSDPTMWHDIVLANQEAVLSALDTFDSGLKNLRTAIESKNSDALLTLFSESKKTRDDFSALLENRISTIE